MMLHAATIALVLCVALGASDRSGDGSAAQDAEPPAAAAPRSARPNIVLIVADDLGWGELGSYGQRWIRTPTLDALAEAGLRFTSFYAGSPVCAPSRCVLLTGRHTGHAWVRDNGNPAERGAPRPADGHFPGQQPLPLESVTLSEVLHDAGYGTAGFGKWGLGFEGSTGDPLRQGFDHFGGYLGQIHAHNHYPRFLWLDGERVEFAGNSRERTGAVHSQDWFVERALAFVRGHTAERPDAPFFLYLPFAVPHLSIQADEALTAEYAASVPEAEHEHRGYLKHPTPRAGYAAMVTQMDRGIGELLALLDELELADDTLVLFTSDNGPTFERLGGADSDFFESSGPFRGRKGSVWEGGLRVPLIARWPGRIPAGATRDTPAAWWDLFPTLAELAGAPIADAVRAELDGRSLGAELLGTAVAEQEARVLYWEFPSYGGQQALREGRWKLVRRGLLGPRETWTLALYDLEQDPCESRDLAAEQPAVVERLLRRAREERRPSALFPFPALDADDGAARANSADSKASD